MKKSSKKAELVKIIDDILWMAARYAHGRSTYAPDMVREAVSKMQKLVPNWQPKKDLAIHAPEDTLPTYIRADYLDDIFNPDNA